FFLVLLVLHFIHIFFFTTTATTAIYTLSLHDALPIWLLGAGRRRDAEDERDGECADDETSLREKPRHANLPDFPVPSVSSGGTRSEEHTSELQSLAYLVCRLLLEKKKKKIKNIM